MGAGGAVAEGEGACAGGNARGAPAQTGSPCLGGCLSPEFRSRPSGPPAKLVCLLAFMIWARSYLEIWPPPLPQFLPLLAGPVSVTEVVGLSSRVGLPYFPCLKLKSPLHATLYISFTYLIPVLRYVLILSNLLGFRC